MKDDSKPSSLVLVAGVFALLVSAAGAFPYAQKKHTQTSERQNPVKATPESIAAGKKLYDTQCTGCHGESGKGDGKMAATINSGPKPADLTDATWDHGSTDDEIYTLIRDGSKGTAMRGFASRMKTDDIWNLVNYLKTLRLTPPASR